MSDPTLATVSATVRQIAGWGLAFDGSTIEATQAQLYDLARQVETYAGDACCPMCEEAECDEDCPLAQVRARHAERL